MNRLNSTNVTTHTPEALSLAVDEASLAAAPNEPAVFVIWAGERSAYLARTTLLRRRLNRVMKMWNLRDVASKIEYWPTASRLEGSLVHLGVARLLFPDDYSKRVKLRFPAFVKLVLSNQFPRTHVTARLTGGRSSYYGPFRTRQSAEQFETRTLELFQIRRCQEDLTPSPEHPGCIYGEMNMCLRPCQQIVGVDEYRSEVNRVADFLRSGGATALNSARAARDRLSEALDFEAAAREHKRYEQIQEVAALRDELAQDIDALSGVAVTRARSADGVCLWFLYRGWWQPPVEFPLHELSGSLDRRLREIVTALEPKTGTSEERQEHVAILAGWAYSSFRDGEWLAFDDLSKLPYRKLVNAIARQRQQAEGSTTGT